MIKVNKKNKLIILSIIILILIVILMVVIFTRKGKKDLEEDFETSSESTQFLHLYTHQVIDIENLNTSLYKESMGKTKNFKIASKYKVGKYATTINAEVDMHLENELMAKPYFIREDDINLNVVQLKLELNQDSREDSKIVQVEKMIRDFERECKMNMDLKDFEKKPDEVSISNENLPYFESIYLNKELYSARYFIEDRHYTEEEINDRQMDKSDYTKTYDINFYMDGDNTLVCEFVQIL